MHFAYPPRKSSNPPPFRPRSSNVPLLRRSHLKTVVLVLLGFLGLLWLLSGSKSDPYHEHLPSGSPAVVIVTVIDPSVYSNVYLKTVQDNRVQYAAKHGYEVFMAKALDYDTGGYQQSWSKIMAMRHALTKFPDCKYIWYLDQDAYIMEPSKKVEDLLEPRTLEGLMVRDYPVVPPDSIIKTFPHLRGQDAGMVISQDNDGLISGSVIIKNGDWAKFLTETWLDPLYRTYNFQRAERHALEHIVQWHPTILSRLALVPQRTFASYVHTNLGSGYHEGDFVAMLHGCSLQGLNACDKESRWYWQRFQENLASM